MKMLKYFSFLTLMFSLLIMFFLFGLKVFVEVVFYFKTDSFSIKQQDVTEIIFLGLIIGIFFSCVVCLVQYIQHKNH
jgi:ABC-type enterochelin transport system permease subunit